MELPKTIENKTEVKTISKTSGIPMNEEEYKEWQKTFTDIEECINNLKGGEDGTSSKTKAKTEKKSN